MKKIIKHKRTMAADIAAEVVSAEAAKPVTKAKAKAAPKKKAASKPTKAAAPKVVKAPVGKRAELLAQCEAGKIPAAPDFSAATHARFRKRLAEITALVKARDLKGLKAMRDSINPISTSPKAMVRYATHAIIAIEAAAKASKRKAA